MRQAFHDGRLADSGLANQHGIVLRTAREHLHHAFDFLIASDQRIELALSRKLGEVAPELIEDRRAARSVGITLLSARGTGRAGILTRLARHHLNDLGTHSRHIRAEIAEDLSGHTVALAHEAEEHVLGADVGVAQLERFA